MALNISGVSRAVALNIFNVCWQDRSYYWSSSQNYGKMLFLLIHFLIVEDYALPKRTSNILSVPLTLECARILFWSIFFFFYFNYLSDDVLYNVLTVSDEPSDLLQQAEIWVVIWSWKYQKYQKMQLCIHSYIDVWEVIL